MKKRIRTLILFTALLLIVPFLLNEPAAWLLDGLGLPSEHSYELGFAAFAVCLLLILNRKRIRLHRQKKRAARAAWRERERLRHSHVLNLSPYEYEEYVAEELRQEGFADVDTTPKSGDYGADVLARDGERKICIQCKRYAPGHPVGVKAVQEVYSAKDYYGCDEAWIYTTSNYTRAAVDMAEELGVILVRTQV